ncbi:hypothetical protein RBB50_000598 [Rhinocladiella similis]
MVSLRPAKWYMTATAPHNNASDLLRPLSLFWNDILVEDLMPERCELAAGGLDNFRLKRYSPSAANVLITWSRMEIYTPTYSTQDDSPGSTQETSSKGRMLS